MKFFIAFVLALAVCGFTSAQGVAGGYIPIQFDPNNQQMVNALNYGVSQAIPQAIASGQISDGVWANAGIISTQEQIVAGINYDFIVNIGDQNGDTARLNVIVYVALDGTMTLSNWAIFMLQSSQQGSRRLQGVAGGYTPIKFNPNNEELVSILDFGVEEAIPEAIATGKIANGEWTYTKVNSVQEQIVAGTNYMFHPFNGTGEFFFSTSQKDFL